MCVSGPAGTVILSLVRFAYMLRTTVPAGAEHYIAGEILRVSALIKVVGNLAKAPDKLQSGACKRQRTSDAIAV